MNLELFIFTYNRAESLRKTLSNLTAEPIRSCQITVLDNHSTDETPQVCEAARSSLPRLRHVRHPKNIGGLANYLRAIELAQADYTWVIADDDSFDFIKAGDLFAQISAGSTDVISAGVEGHTLPAGASGQLRSFALRNDFFLSHSFVPSIVFRSRLFDGDCLRAGYDNIDTMFPHFPFLISVAESDRSIYVSREKIIRKSNNVGYSTFRFMSGWLKSCRRFRQRDLRVKAVSEVFSGRNFLRMLVFSTLIERQFRPRQCRSEFLELRAQAARTDRLIWLKLLMFSPLMAMPDPLHRAAWKKYAAYRQQLGTTLPNFDEAR